jgi:hypothetical protein
MIIESRVVFFCSSHHSVDKSAMKGNALIAFLLFIATSVQGLRVIEPEEFAGYYNSPWIDRYGKNM